MALVTLRQDAAEPPYEQVRAQIADGIADGSLPPGTRLPAVRRLAGDLGIAPNTVARAYRELETAGLVRTAGRNGTVVAARAEDDRDVVAIVDAFIADMSARGVNADEVHALVQRRLISRDESPTSTV